MTIAARGDRWAHLSLCVVDAAFSIGARYSSVVFPTVKRVAERAPIAQPWLLTATNDGGQRVGVEQPLSEFLGQLGDRSGEELARELFGNRQRTSSRGGILKAEAVRKLASVLVGNEIELLDDAATLLRDEDRTRAVEAQLNSVKGSGQSGVRTGFLWMVAGDDHTVKPDRHILGWLRSALGSTPSVATARRLLTETAAELHVTPWELDHAIWRHRSALGRRRA